MALQMKMSKALLVAILTGLLLPAAAAAVGPPRTPAVIVSEGFESGTTPAYEVTTLGQPSSARWAPVARAYPGSVRGLWCAGSAGLLANYPVGTFGYASFAFPQAADHYASKVEFRYLMPTVGSGDPFQLLWARTGEDGVDPIIYLPTTSSWKLLTQDLTVGSRSLARRAGQVAFRFDDLNRVSSPSVGQGPTIDDVVISGWKYGPVRDLHAAPSATGVVLSWSKPYRAAGESVVEERDVAYRVWRAPAGTEAWTEITPSRITATSLSEDPPGAYDSYLYAVQAWDPSGGSGYGEPVEVSATLPRTPTSLSSWSSASVIAYGGSTTISGKLIGPLGPIEGKTVEVWSRSYLSGSAWTKSSALRTTAADGSVSWTAKPTVRTYYQIRYPGAGGYSASTGTAQLISPKVSLTAPRNGSAVKRGRVYTWYGYLKPKHTTGSSVARLQFQRKVGGVYKPYKTLTAKGYYASSLTTKYSLRTSLPTKGMWRVRAYHKDAGHHLTYSGWLYKNVK